MNRDNAPWRPQPAADVAWDDAGNPRSGEFGDIYYSRDNGLEESRHVFLAGNDLPARWQTHHAPCFTVGETGFGSGLNFLVAWQAWRETPDPKPDLHYLCVECYPLQQPDLARALATWEPLVELAGQLAAAYPPLVPGQHRLVFEHGRVRLDIWFEDATKALDDLASLGRPFVNAWFLDGFAPARNPGMWTAGLCASVGALTTPGGTFATFTAAGQVRRDLEQAGFNVTKTPGYGRKRERLVGTRTATSVTKGTGHTALRITPWDLSQDAGCRPSSAIVLGAGLAGCTVAFSLARRGVEVTVLDREGVAGGASGNEQGILYTRLSRKHSALTDFALQSYIHATRLYSTLFEQGRLVRGVDGELCGNVQLGTDQAEIDYLQPLLDNAGDLASVVSPTQASALCGQDLASGGYWFPGSGWLHPPAVCRALLDNPRIRYLEHCGDVVLQQSGLEWQASTGDSVLATAGCAVIAAGDNCNTVAGLSWLPLQKIRGQTTLVPAGTIPGGLATTVCDEGYIAPARNGLHCTGASFVLQYDNLQPSEGEHRENLGRVGSMLPAARAGLAQLDAAALQGRVGVRCASPDYLPLVGPVPDIDAFVEQFGALRRNARRPLDQRGSYRPGLYLSTAHGSRGLTSTPLLAEMLASQVCGEAPPVSRELARATAPARFIIRDLSRNRI